MTPDVIAVCVTTVVCVALICLTFGWMWWADR